MNKRRGLGRGLQALIPAVGEEDGRSEKLREIDIGQIRPSAGQARKKFDEEKLDELAASIKEHGVVQPVVVRPLQEGGFELVAGERRLRACKLLGYRKIPAVVKDCEDLEAVAVSLIENIQREDLNPIEEAAAYSQLMKNYGLTQEELSSRVGKSRPFIANMVRLLGLPEEIKEMLAGGRLSAGHARALLAIKDAEKQVAAAGKIAARQLSVRQAEKIAKRLLEERLVKEREKIERSRYIAETEQKLQALFEGRVKIRETRGGGGVLEIKFKNEAELERISELLKG
ncbi:MAG TPA: ParB/RepB/Spo0J family partition protein [Bacillota bacterium]|nr:ParB/RepB/Spo0J family partition protein [Bacillota bacterium]